MKINQILDLHYLDITTLDSEPPNFIRSVNWLTGHVIDSEGCPTMLGPTHVTRENTAPISPKLHTSFKPTLKNGPLVLKHHCMFCFDFWVMKLNICGSIKKCVTGVWVVWRWVCTRMSLFNCFFFVFCFCFLCVMVYSVKRTHALSLFK